VKLKNGKRRKKGKKKKTGEEKNKNRREQKLKGMEATEVYWSVVTW
jgi:hypothetical protein